MQDIYGRCAIHIHVYLCTCVCAFVHMYMYKYLCAHLSVCLPASVGLSLQFAIGCVTFHSSTPHATTTDNCCVFVVVVAVVAIAAL